MLAANWHSWITSGVGGSSRRQLQVPQRSWSTLSDAATAEDSTPQLGQRYSFISLWNWNWKEAFSSHLLLSLTYWKCVQKWFSFPCRSLRMGLLLDKESFSLLVLLLGSLPGSRRVRPVWLCGMMSFRQKIGSPGSSSKKGARQASDWLHWRRIEAQWFFITNLSLPATLLLIKACVLTDETSNQSLYKSTPLIKSSRVTYRAWHITSRFSSNIYLALCSFMIFIFLGLCSSPVLVSNQSLHILSLWVLSSGKTTQTDLSKKSSFNMTEDGGFVIIIGTIMSSQFPRATLWLCAVKDVDVDTMRCLNMKSSVALSIKSKDFNINAPRTVLYVL